MVSRGRSVPERVLGIDFISRGFGFAVLEGPRSLVDWGVVHAGRPRDAATVLRSIAVLLARYAPDTLAIEDIAQNPRRSPALRALVPKVRRLTIDNATKYTVVSLDQVRRALGHLARTTKHETATDIARRFPELAPRLPPQRKPWTSEADAMAIFDATGLVLGVFTEDGIREIGR